MRVNSWAVAVSVFLTVAFVSGPAFPADSPYEKEVKAFADAYVSAYEKKDVNTLLMMISTAPPAVSVDTEANGRHVGPAAIKTQLQNEFKEFKSAKLNRTWISVAGKGDVAWFASEWVAEMDMGPEKAKIPARWTGVLEKQGGKWLLVLSHFSFTAMPEPQQPPKKK